MHRSHALSASIGALQIIRVRALHSRSCRRHVRIARYPVYAQTSMYRVVEARELPFGIPAGLGCKWHPADHLRRRANPSRLCGTERTRYRGRALRARGPYTGI